MDVFKAVGQQQVNSTNYKVRASSCSSEVPRTFGRNINRWQVALRYAGLLVNDEVSPSYRKSIVGPSILPSTFRALRLDAVFATVHLVLFPDNI